MEGFCFSSKPLHNLLIWQVVKLFYFIINPGFFQFSIRNNISSICTSKEKSIGLNHLYHHFCTTFLVNTVVIHFRNMYVHLSQNCASDGHFDLLNWLKSDWFKSYDTKLKYFHYITPNYRGHSFRNRVYLRWILKLINDLTTLSNCHTVGI